jgi:hypothetical protein
MSEECRCSHNRHPLRHSSSHLECEIRRSNEPATSCTWSRLFPACLTFEDRPSLWVPREQESVDPLALLRHIDRVPVLCQHLVQKRAPCRGKVCSRPSVPPLGPQPRPKRTCHLLLHDCHLWHGPPAVSEGLVRNLAGIHASHCSDQNHCSDHSSRRYSVRRCSLYQSNLWNMHATGLACPVLHCLPQFVVESIGFPMAAHVLFTKHATMLYSTCHA